MTKQPPHKSSSEPKGKSPRRWRWFLLVVGALGLLTVVWEFAPSKAERKGREIAESIEQRLKKPGDWVKVSEVYPGQWTLVCVHPSTSTGGALTRRILEPKFGVTQNTMHFPNGVPGASDWNWVLMFFYPPDTLEMLAVPTESFLGFVSMANRHDQLPRCQKAEQAVLYLRSVRQGKYPPQLILRTIDKQKGGLDDR